MNYDALANRNPILNYLMGIASQLSNSDPLKKLVVLDYIADILDELKMPRSILVEYKKVMGMTVYEEEIA